MRLLLLRLLLLLLLLLLPLPPNCTQGLAIYAFLTPPQFFASSANLRPYYSLLKLHSLRDISIIHASQFCNTPPTMERLLPFERMTDNLGRVAATRGQARVTERDNEFRNSKYKLLISLGDAAGSYKWASSRSARPAFDISVPVVSWERQDARPLSWKREPVMWGALRTNALSSFYCVLYLYFLGPFTKPGMFPITSLCGFAETSPASARKCILGCNAHRKSSFIAPWLKLPVHNLSASVQIGGFERIHLQRTIVAAFQTALSIPHSAIDLCSDAEKTLHTLPRQFPTCSYSPWADDADACILKCKHKFHAAPKKNTCSTSEPKKSKITSHLAAFSTFLQRSKGVYHAKRNITASAVPDLKP
ncbi:hypothetical protein BDZ91DRAFT_779728 [Kalaharituber pfeilii]|nr:hypothetical protein BDZ91DRAFT_779728 [Kalaharituber pfeilii]